MASNLFTVAGQVLVLFSLVVVGYLCARGGIVPLSAVPGMNNLVLYAATPCMLINAFRLDLTPQTLRDFLVSLACAAAIFVWTFVAAHFLVRDKDRHRKRMLTLAAVFPNCNFMGLPLQTAILGSTGVFYGSAFGAMCPLFLWTVGIYYLHGETTSFSWKKAFLNPGVLGMAAGLLMFFSGLRLPSLADQAVIHLANLAVPLPMLIIGIQLAHTDLVQTLRDRVGWLVGLLRLIVFPVASLFVMYLLGVRGPVLVATTIACATPPAVIVSMFDRPDSTLGAEMVSLHTICSIATMPLVVSLAQTLAG